MRTSTNSTSILAALATAFVLGACRDNTIDGLKAAPQNPNAVLGCGPTGCGGDPPDEGPVPGISAFSLNATYLELSGLQATYSYHATLTNTGTAATNAHVSLAIIQGGGSTTLKSIALSCGSGTNVLPSGGCSTTNTIIISDYPAAVVPLIPGPATLKFTLSAGGATVSRSLGVTLVPGRTAYVHPVEISLAGTSWGFGTVFQNDGPTAISGLNYQLKISQGSALRTLATAYPQCNGQPFDVMPAHGLCNALTTFSVNPTNPGVGTLVAGAATAQEIYSNGTTVYATSTSAVTLRDARITSASVGPTSPVIEGGAQPYTINVMNNSTPVPTPDVNYMIVQGADTAIAPSVSFFSGCVGGAATTTLPSGACTITGTYVVPKTRSGHSFSPGSAQLILQVERTKIVILDTKSTPITLVAP